MYQFEPATCVCESTPCCWTIYIYIFWRQQFQMVQLHNLESLGGPFGMIDKMLCMLLHVGNPWCTEAMPTWVQSNGAISSWQHRSWASCKFFWLQIDLVNSVKATTLNNLFTFVYCGRVIGRFRLHRSVHYRIILGTSGKCLRCRNCSEPRNSIWGLDKNTRTWRLKASLSAEGLF